MKNAEVLQKTRDFVKEKLAGEGSGHDWWHVVRVVNNAKAIAKVEGGDLFVVELGALLHDIADWKFHNGDTTVGPKVAHEWLTELKVEMATIEAVVEIVEHISYRGGTNTHVMQTLEGKIVQDADRLDALGAIGIARTFIFGENRGQVLHDPATQPKQYESFQEFRESIKGNTMTIHFYEKLLLLKDKMNTPTGRAMAEHRHEYMEKYQEEFYAEWEGKK